MPFSGSRAIGSSDSASSRNTRAPSGAACSTLDSLARAISFNGLSNAFTIAAINGGRHVNPLFAGDTVFAWSQVLDKQTFGHRKDVGALRLRLVATKNLPCGDFPDKDEKGAYPENVILDFDYWAILPRG